MKTPEQVSKVYYQQRKWLLRIAFSRMASIPSNHKETELLKRNWQTQVTVTGKLMFNEVDAEKIVDDLLIKVLNSRRMKLGFTNNKHVIGYMVNGLKRNINRAFAIRYHELIPKLTEKEREENFDLARDIINKVRPIETS